MKAQTLAARCTSGVVMSVLGALALGSTACGPSKAATEAPRTAEEQPTEGRVGVHGMVVFGPNKDGSVYISHIPLYAPPGDIQMVARVHMTPLPGDYIPKNLHDGMYTMEPDTFSLDRLISGQVLSFQANFYQGFFEERAKRLAHGMKVDMDSMIFPPRPLDPKAPKFAEPTYVAFGTTQDVYLVHLIGGAPDFDQILYGHVTSGLDDTTLAKSISVVAKGKVNDASHRILTRDKPTLTTFDGKAVQFEIVKELSCLTGDGFNQQCPLGGG